jgi:hypothetical protein
MSFLMEKAISSLCPNAQWKLVGGVYSGLTWMDTTQAKPSEAAINAEIARLEADAPFAACKAEAKKRIAASDWSVLPDVNISNGAEFEDYRAELRELIINPVANPTFPTEPEPVWI